MLPQQPSKQTATAPPLNLCRSQAPGRVKESPNPPNPSCCRSRGGMRGWPLPRPTHAPATTLKTNGNSAPIKPMSFPSSASECVPRSSASPTTPPGNNPQNKRSPRRAQHKKRASKGAQNPPPRRHPARKIAAQLLEIWKLHRESHRFAKRRRNLNLQILCVVTGGSRRWSFSCHHNFSVAIRVNGRSQNIEAAVIC